MNFDPKQTSLVTMQMGPNYPSVTRSLGHGSMLVRNAGKVPNDVSSQRAISMQTLEHAVGAIVNTHMSGNQFHWHANSVQRWASQSSTAVNLFWKRPWDICLLSVWILAVTDTSFSSKFFSISISIWPLTKEWKEKGIQWQGGEEYDVKREQICYCHKREQRISCHDCVTLHLYANLLFSFLFLEWRHQSGKADRQHFRLGKAIDIGRVNCSRTSSTSCSELQLTRRSNAVVKNCHTRGSARRTIKNKQIMPTTSTRKITQRFWRIQEKSIKRHQKLINIDSCLVNAITRKPLDKNRI